MTVGVILVWTLLTQMHSVQMQIQVFTHPRTRKTHPASIRHCAPWMWHLPHGGIVISEMSVYYSLFMISPVTAGSRVQCDSSALSALWPLLHPQPAFFNPQENFMKQLLLFSSYKLKKLSLFKKLILIS